MARRPVRVSASAKWIAGVLVGLLAVGTVVLALLAVDRVRSTPEPSAPEPVPSFSLGPPRTASPSPSPSESASPASLSESTESADAGERFLTVGSGAMWRATGGACGGTAPLIERSTDAGATWRDVTPRYRGIGQVVSLDAFAQVQGESIAAMGADCHVEALRTFTQGQFWQPYPDVLAASRYLDPADPASVVLPAGTVAAPCEAPQSFRAMGDIVALVCDGTASRWVDGEWSALPADGVAALAVANGTVLTAGVADGCSGVAVTRWSGADLATSTALGCAADADASAPLAVAATATGALVWSGDALIAAQ